MDVPEGSPREVISRRLTISAVETLVVTFRETWTCATVYFDARGEANAAATVVRVYAVCKGLRALVASYTATYATQAYVWTIPTEGASVFEVTVQTPTAPTAREVAVGAVGFGKEPSAGTYTVPSRVTAFDSNHVLAYTLDKAAGTTTLSNEGSGGTADLAVTFTPAGTLVPYQPAGITFEEVSPAGNCAAFRKGVGAFGRITGGGSLVLPSGTQPFTVEATFLTLRNDNGTGANTRIIEKTNSWLLYQGSNAANLAFGIYNGSNYTTILNVIPQTVVQTWYQVGAVCTGTNIIMYINGIQFDNNDNTTYASVPATALPIEIGTFGTGTPGLYAGNHMIRDVSVSNIARPASYFKAKWRTWSQAA